MTAEQLERFNNFINDDDLDFYEEFVINLSVEEQVKFFEENPEFMSEYSISSGEIELLQDEMYRVILRKIKKYEGGKRLWKEEKQLNG